MLFARTSRFLILTGVIFLTGCAANQLPGFQNTYYSYNVPQSLVEQIKADLKKYGLPNAQVTRDSVGRIRLVGSYKNEDEVDRAFVIVQSIVGIKSASPFYPENVKEKRWEANAREALEQFSKVSRSAQIKPQVKRALIIGINEFLYRGISSIQGEDDARLVKDRAEKAGYMTTSLFGAQATKGNIEAAIDKMKKIIGPNDSLLVYISSHGEQPLPSPKGGDARKMSIIAYDTEVPNYKNKTDFYLKMHATSVPDTKLQELVQMQARQKRVIIDTCYSGDILQGALDTSSRYILETNGGYPERSGVSIASWTGPEYMSKGIQFHEDAGANDESKPKEKNRSTASAWVAGDNQNPYTIITATSDGQKSWGPNIQAGGTFDSPVTPGKKLKGSFFTQAFFEYLEKYEGHLEPAFKDAQKFTYNQLLNNPPPVSNSDGPPPILQTPRMEPPLPPGNRSGLYE